MELDVKLAATVTPEFLAGLSHRELITLADAVSERTGEPVLKEDARDRAIEKDLAEDLDEDWTDDYEPAAIAAIAGLPEEDVSLEEVESALAKINSDLEGRSTGGTSEILVSALSATALLSRNRTRAALATTNPSAAALIGASLSQADVAAITASSGQQLWWIGDLWGGNFSPVILETVRREALIRGLGRSAVGRIMNGVVTGTFPAAAVPGTWRGGKGSYFEMLAGTVRARQSASGALYALRDAGLSRYRFQAVLDERTSEQCRELHDRVFLVDDGIALSERADSAENPEEFKAIAGWRSADDIRGIIGNQTGAEASRSLTESGIMWPPLHARCRSVVSSE